MFTKYCLVAILFATSFSDLFSSNLPLSQRLINEFLRIKKENLENIHNKQGIKHRNCLTPLLFEVRQNWDKLTPSAKEFFKDIMARPNLSNEKILNTKHFAIHYTFTGTDKVDSTDSNLNGTADYVEKMAQVFENVYNADSVTFGYTMPPSDSIAGGSFLYDIYIYNIGIGLYGAVAGDSLIYDNPKSVNRVETYAMTSYMKMNNDYSWLNNTDTAIMVTAAHEFYHSIQFGYNVFGSTFLKEATAAWMEDVNYPGMDDNLQYLNSIFYTPDVALNLSKTDSATVYGDHWYGSWIFFKYMQERFSADIVRKIFERIAINPDFENLKEFDAMDVELTNYGTSLSEFCGGWTIANLLLTNDSVATPHIYSRANIYKKFLKKKSTLPDTNWLFYESKLNFVSNSINWNSQTNGNGRLMRLSADYHSIKSNKNFSVVMTNFDTTSLYMLMVKTKNSPYNMTITEPTMVSSNLVINIADYTNFDNFSLVVMRYDPNTKDTLSKQYSLIIGDLITEVPEIAKPKPHQLISVYTKGGIFVKFSDEANPTHFELTDLTGRIVSKGKINNKSSNTLIPTGILTKGLYFARFFSKQDLLSVEKIIVIE